MDINLFLRNKFTETMKRHYLMAALIVPSSLAAQSLTLGNMLPSFAGDHTLYACPFQENSAPGTGQMWDFSNLTAGDGASFSYIDPASQPGSAAFLNTNVAVLYPGSLTSLDYLTYNDSGIYLIGSAIPSIGYQQVYQNTKRILPFPCSAGTIWQDTFSGDWSNGPSQMQETGGITGEAEATGTLVMPYGTLDNVLRVIRTTHDSLTISGQGYVVLDLMETEYYKPGVPKSLLSFTNQVSSGTAPGANFSDSLGSWLDGGSVEVREALRNAIGIDLYPNPAKSSSTLVFSSQGGSHSVDLLDASGRVVRHEDLMVQPGISRSNLDLHGLQSGLYMVRITSADGSQGVQRLVVE